MYDPPANEWPHKPLKYEERHDANRPMSHETYDSRGNRQQSRGRAARNRDEDEGRDDRNDRDEAAEQEPAPRPSRRPARRARQDDSADKGAEQNRAGIDTAVLPPAIGRTERSAEGGEAAEAAPAPKPRRTRKTLAAAPRDTGVEAAE